MFGTPSKQQCQTHPRPDIDLAEVVSTAKLQKWLHDKNKQQVEYAVPGLPTNLCFSLSKQTEVSLTGLGS